MGLPRRIYGVVAKSTEIGRFLDERVPGFDAELSDCPKLSRKLCQCPHIAQNFLEGFGQSDNSASKLGIRSSKNLPISVDFATTPYILRGNPIWNIAREMIYFDISLYIMFIYFN